MLSPVTRGFILIGSSSWNDRINSGLLESLASGLDIDRARQGTIAGSRKGRKTSSATGMLRPAASAEGALEVGEWRGVQHWKNAPPSPRDLADPRWRDK